MKPYIDLYTQKCKEALDDFSKDFYKLMNVFGRTEETVRDRVHVKFVKREKEIEK